MPVIGERINPNKFNKGYEHDPLRSYCESFRDLAEDISQTNGVDIFKDPDRVLMYENSYQTLKDFFVENSYDPEDPRFSDPQVLEEHMDMMSSLFENDREGVLHEYAALNQFNPVIGLTFPIHKNNLMNNIFDSGVITKYVANSPKFTISMETRIFKDADGKEYDMWKEQGEMFDAMERTVPTVEIPISLPENMTTNILGRLGASELDDNISIETHISGVCASVYLKTGQKYKTIDTDTDGNEIVVEKEATADGVVDNVIVRVHKEFHSGYGDFDRQLIDSVSISVPTDANGTTEIISTALTGYQQNNRFTLMSSNTKINKVIVSARFDASRAMHRTCSVAWKIRTDPVEIPDAKPINVFVSPEELKDVAALYNVNQLTKVMSLIKIVMANWKDDKIRKYLDDSFIRLPDELKLARAFDFAPRADYYSDHIEWRQKTFMEFLDDMITQLLHVYNDPNMTISVIGRDTLVRKITPVEYTYSTPSSIGEIEMDFLKTVVTNDRRVYQFVSSDKLRNNNNMMIILNPRNTDRIIYRIYDYQQFVSSDIRNAVTYTHPAVHVFDRWKFVEYQPVQGRIQIVNPTGLRPNQVPAVTDPIGARKAANNMNIDFENGLDFPTASASTDGKNP